MRAKKSLGQNFLNNKGVVRDIVEAAELTSDLVVFEIGPGKGALTAEMLDRGYIVVALETDERMIEMLEERFSLEIKERRLILIKGDIKEVSVSETMRRYGSYSVVANIPYFLTGLIIRKLLEEELQPVSITLVVQKEIAQRVVSRDGKESILSIAVAAYGKARYVKKIPRRYFSPQPKVDSGILHIFDIGRSRFGEVKEERFFEIVRAGFLHKRKKLIKNLEGASVSPALLESAFEKIGLDTNVRAEELSVDHWFALVGLIHN